MPWSLPMGPLLETYAGNMDKAVRDLALQALRGVVLKTPVDTGRLRGGWLVSKDFPNGEVTTGTDVAGATTITAGSVKIEGIKAGGLIYIQNNVEYGVYINNGTPTISPRRMVERTIEELGGT